MHDKDKPNLGNGGAKQTRSSAIDDKDSDPALQKEHRQAAKNQGKAKPEDYPDRHQYPV